MKSRGNDVRLVVVAAFWTALGITALLFVAVRVLGDDHRPVKTPQPVLEWAVRQAVFSSAPPPSGLFGEFVHAADKNADPHKLPYRVNVSESGKAVVQYETTDWRTLHPVFVDSDWCGREYGHVWVGGPDFQFTDDLVYHPPDPCEGHNYTEHYICTICRLKKTVKHTCKADGEQTTYEKPGVKKP